MNRVSYPVRGTTVILPGSYIDDDGEVWTSPGKIHSLRGVNFMSVHVHDITSKDGRFIVRKDEVTRQSVYLDGECYYLDLPMSRFRSPIARVSHLDGEILLDVSCGSGMALVCRGEGKLHVEFTEPVLRAAFQRSKVAG